MKAIIFSEIDPFYLNKYDKIYEFHKWNFNEDNPKGRSFDLLNLSKEDFFSEKARKKLETIYEELLYKISLKLNKFHHKSFPPETWEILIGPWLRISIFGFFDRWETVKKIHILKDDIEIVMHKKSFEKSIPKDFNDFHELFYDDECNSLIYSFIAEFFSINVSVLPSYKSKLRESTSPSASLPNRSSSKKINLRNTSIKILNIFHFFHSLNSLFSKKYKRVLISGIPDYLKFSLFLLVNRKGFPHILDLKESKKRSTKKISYGFRLRNVIKIKSLGKYDSEKVNETSLMSQILEAFLCASIPRTYLEDFTFVQDYLVSKTPKRKFDIVYSSTDQWNNDFFKSWLLLQKIKNEHLKTVIWQHGGTYGTTKYLTHQESLETKIYDYFLTWGWNSKSSKILPFFAFFHLKNFISQKEKSEGNNRILVVSTRVKRYSKGDPWDSDRWNIDYVNSLKKISRFNINNHEIVFRVHPSQHRHGLDLRDILSEEKNINFDYFKNISNSIGSSKLILVTQNSTTFLQSFLANIPTICFWNIEINPFREESKKDFDKLKDLNIFQSNIDDLESFLIQNINSIDNWWNSKEVQDAKNLFCQKYSTHSKVVGKESLSVIYR
tara:strand:- start:26231 stop:28060 length:1830 start_codon:yes stop_codon:yes gene_type:complete